MITAANLPERVRTFRRQSASDTCACTMTSTARSHSTTVSCIVRANARRRRTPPHSFGLFGSSAPPSSGSTPPRGVPRTLCSSSSSIRRFSRQVAQGTRIGSIATQCHLVRNANSAAVRGVFPSPTATRVTRSSDAGCVDARCVRTAALIAKLSVSSFASGKSRRRMSSGAHARRRHSLTYRVNVGPAFGADARERPGSSDARRDLRDDRDRALAFSSLSSSRSSPVDDACPSSPRDSWRSARTWAFAGRRSHVALRWPFRRLAGTKTPG